MKAGWPVRISQRIEPSANTSARSSRWSFSPRACSGRHVGGRPQHRPGVREVQVRARPAPGRGDDRLVDLQLAGLGIVDRAPARQDLGQAPVHHLDLAEAAHHHVGRLQVAVDHPPGVRVGDRLGDVEEDRQEPGMVARRVGPLVHHLGQGPALDQLHGEVGPPVGEGAQLVDRDDAGVLELAGDLGLLDEAAEQLGVAAVAFQEHLDGEVAAQVVVSPFQDRSHAPPGDLAEELEPPGAVGGVGHLGRGGADDRARAVDRLGVAEQDPADRADRLAQALQDSRASPPASRGGEGARRAGPPAVGAGLARPRREVGGPGEPEQARGAEAVRRVRRPFRAATRAGVVVRHGGYSGRDMDRNVRIGSSYSRKGRFATDRPSDRADAPRTSAGRIAVTPQGQARTRGSRS